MKVFFQVIGVFIVISLFAALFVSAKDPCSNVEKLDGQLKDAGIPIDGVNSKCLVWFKNNATLSQKNLAAVIVANYTDALTIDQILRQRIGIIIAQVIHLTGQQDTPANATTGDIYYNTVADEFCFRYADGTWEGLRKKNGC